VTVLHSKDRTSSIWSLMLFFAS